MQLDAEDGDLLALVSQRERQNARLRVLREVDGRWGSTPQLSAPAAVAQLAIGKVSSDSPAIGLATQERSAKRLVFQLRGGEWQQLDPAVEDVGIGPLVGGPVLLSKRVLYPVTQADSTPWSFSVQSARIGASNMKVSRLSSGAGNAQGGLDLTGGQVWATWQENDPIKDGRFKTRIYAAELSQTGRVKRKIRLWRGLSIGPGSIQVLSFQDETLALFMRGSSNGHGLQATVKALPSVD